MEGEIKPLVEQFLQKRGLALSPAKTVITHVGKGFDFLGQNVRKYPNGKLLIKPSKKNVKTFQGGIRKTIRAALGMPAADLIGWLNPKIPGWANYHRHVVTKRAFHHVDHPIFTSLWQWARRRHQKKSPGWLKQKYFARQGGNNWIFFAELCDNAVIPHKLRLLLASSTPIRRYVKVKGEANPYDPACESYFEKREADHMAATFRSTRALRFLWNVQAASAPSVKSASPGSRVGVFIIASPRAGRSRTMPYFIQSATTGFIATIFLSRTASPRKRRSKGLSRMTGNCHVRF